MLRTVILMLFLALSLTSCGGAMGSDDATGEGWYCTKSRTRESCVRTEATCEALEYRSTPCTWRAQAVCLRYRLVVSEEEGLHCSPTQELCDRYRRSMRPDRQMMANCTMFR